MTLSGIEPATFQLVAQRLNLLRHRVPGNITYLQIKTTKVLHQQGFKLISINRRVQSCSTRDLNREVQQIVNLYILHITLKIKVLYWQQTRVCNREIIHPANSSSGSQLLHKSQSSCMTSWGTGNRFMHTHCHRFHFIWIHVNRKSLLLLHRITGIKCSQPHNCFHLQQRES